MASMPIVSTKPPDVIAAQPNGAVDERLLEVVDRNGYLWKMASKPARGMRAMHAAIKRDLGVTLTSTGRGRDLPGQWLIFGGGQARYRPCSIEEFEAAKRRDRELVKFWPAGERAKVALLLPTVTIPEAEHWVKIQFPNGSFPATAAVPGTSPHGMWCADDLAMPDGPDKNSGPDTLPGHVVQWLFEHEQEFGFAHGSRSENWHVQWVAGDTMPAAVLAYEASIGVFVSERGGDGSTELQEEDMTKAIKLADNDAIFTASGGVASWINDPEDYGRLVTAKLAPPIEQVEIIDRLTLSALRLVGAIPPGFTAGDFQEVIDQLVPQPVPPPSQPVV
jgi:hypothetical protein